MSKGLIPLLLAVGSASCTALLGLDDKPFTGTTESSGGGGSATSTSTSGGGGEGGLGGSASSGGGQGGTGGSGGSGSDRVLWAVGSTGLGMGALEGLAVSKTGDIWIVGSFQASIELPGCAPLVTTATQAVFWAKLDPGGACTQLHMLGGSMAGPGGHLAQGLVIALDGNDVPAIGGSFRGVLKDPLDPTTPLTSTLMTLDIFLARLDPNDGHVTHKQSFHGTGEDKVTSIVFDDGNSLYAGGSFRGTLTLPTDPPTALDATDTLRSDGLLLRVSSGGTVHWAKQLTGNGHSTEIEAVTFVSSQQAIGFSGMSGGKVTGLCDWSSAGVNVSDAFHAAVNTDGECLFGEAAGSNSTASSRALDSDSMGRFVSAGEFRGAINLGANPPVSAAALDTNGFVARVDWNHGPPMHAVATFGNGGGQGAEDRARALYVDKSDGVCVTGSIQNYTDFSGTGVLGLGGDDAFVAKYDAATLSLTWVLVLGDGKLQQGTAIWADPNDDAVVAGGVFQGTLGGAGPSPPVASNGLQSVYVMKLAP